ncbi:hypothetical protein [Pseudarthrobacter sp. MDT1-22]
MPVPSTEFAPLMREMSEMLLKGFPTASVFAWHVLTDWGGQTLDRPQVYISGMYDGDGEWIGGESLGSAENLIVARYQDRLGWAQREEGIGHAYSVKQAREITDVDGTGTLDPEFAAHPGLESFQ